MTRKGFTLFAKARGFTLMRLPFFSFEKKRSRQGFTLISLLSPFGERSYKRKTGFTLIELMVSISIVAVLATIGFSSFQQSQLRARDAKRKQDLRAVAQALELFYQQNRRFPCSGTGWQASNSSGWLTDSNSCTGGTNQRIDPRFINRLPRDPVSDDGVPTGSSGFGYAYYSINAPYNAACPIGQYYILIAKLENANDTERLGSGTFSICGTTASVAGNSYHPNQFVIASP